MEYDFKGKRVLVTAGADGIGKTIALAFYRLNAAVFICCRTLEKLRDLAKDNPGLKYCVADVSNYKDVEHMFCQIINDMGGLDILVNNAGISGPTGRVDTINVQDWTDTFRTNIDSQFFCTKLAVPLMIEAGGGEIINISSTAGLFAYPNRSPYAASKCATIGFTKSTALELGKFNIRVNAICPGCVEGVRIERVIEREAQNLGVSKQEVRDGYLKQTALHTFVKGEDIANMCLYLCSPYGEKISGQYITIDGFTENCHS